MKQVFKYGDRVIKKQLNVVLGIMWEYFTLQKNLKSLYSQKDIKEINKVLLLGHNIMMTVSCAEYKQKQHEFIKQFRIISYWGDVCSALTKML